MKTVSQELKEWYMNVQYESTRSGHFLNAKRKPNKRIEKEANQLFLSFGGVEENKFKWEFTYDPRDVIQKAFTYGYILTPKQNFLFLPTQIEKTMSAFLNLPQGSKVLYPFYGYGYSSLIHQEYNCIPLNNYVGENSAVWINMDGVFFRPNLRKDIESIYEYSQYLRPGGIFVGIAEDLTLADKKLNEFIDMKFSTYKAYKIPNPTWIPSYANEQICASILWGIKK